MENDVIEFRFDAVEEDVRDLKQLSAQIVNAQSKTDARLAGLEGELKIQNQVLKEGFDLIRRVMMAGIGVISVVFTGTQLLMP
tara:strand:+ start:854 stop:1102 length:249 start_codon:yes stop_codon:yes gene_type:complete